MADQDVLAVEAALAAEASAHVRRDDPDAVLGEPQRVGQVDPGPVRSLGREPYGELVPGRLGIRQHTPCLHRHGHHPGALHVQAADMVRFGERLVDVASLSLHGIAVVGAELFVGQRRAVFQGGLGVGDNGEGFISHLNGRGRVLGHGAALRHHRRYGRPHRVDRAPGQHRMIRHVHARRHHGCLESQAPDVVAREHAFHAGHGRGFGCIDGQEPGVGVRAPVNRHVQDARQLHVVHVASLAGEQGRVLDPPDGSADKVRRAALLCTHGSSSKVRAAGDGDT